jgi:hypothetical protein
VFMWFGKGVIVRGREGLKQANLNLWLKISPPYLIFYLGLYAT